MRKKKQAKKDKFLRDEAAAKEILNRVKHQCGICLENLGRIINASTIGAESALVAVRRVLAGKHAQAGVDCYCGRRHRKTSEKIQR